MNQPIIGITLDQENKKTYSNFPWYAARKNYAECVTLCGGVPIFLPHVESRIDNYLEIINGLIITGGDFDVDPNLYGEKDINPNVVLKPDRTNFELKITETEKKKNSFTWNLWRSTTFKCHPWWFTISTYSRRI